MVQETPLKRQRWQSTAAAMAAGWWALTGAASVHAQPRHETPVAAADPQRKEAARAAYKEAEVKLKAGDHRGAYDLYKTADDILPIAATKYKMALCKDKLGQTVEAVNGYQAFLDASPDPAKLGDAITEAQTRLSALRRRVGRVRLLVTPHLPALTVSIDGTPQPASAMSAAMVTPAPGAPPARAFALTMMPGHRRLTASAPGYAPVAMELDIGAAGTRDVRITLTPTGRPPAGPAAGPSLPPYVPPPVPPRSNVPAYVMFGGAGAGVIAGSILGALALVSKSDFNAHPTVARADKTDQLALGSDIAFGAGLALAVTGTVLLLTNRPRWTAFATPHISAQSAGAAVTVSF